jgi:hypothetical protein
MSGAANGHALAEMPAPAELPAEMPGIAVDARMLPGGAGVALSLVTTGVPKEDETRLTAAFSVQQTRDLCGQLLRMCDALSKGTERTIMVVTGTAYWVPGQILMSRWLGDQTGYHHSWHVQSRFAQAQKPRLILPGG